MTTTREWLDLPAAADYVGQSVRWIKDRIYSGELVYYNPTGRKSFIKKSDLDAYIESGRVEHPSSADLAKEAEIQWET